MDAKFKFVQEKFAHILRSFFQTNVTGNLLKQLRFPLHRIYCFKETVSPDKKFLDLILMKSPCLGHVTPDIELFF